MRLGNSSRRAITSAVSWQAQTKQTTNCLGTAGIKKGKTAIIVCFLKLTTYASHKDHLLLRKSCRLRFLKSKKQTLCSSQHLSVCFWSSNQQTLRQGKQTCARRNVQNNTSWSQKPKKKKTKKSASEANHSFPAPIFITGILAQTVQTLFLQYTYKISQSQTPIYTDSMSKSSTNH